MDKKKLKKILLSIFIPLGIIALTAMAFGFWYYYIRETPKVIVKKAIKAARQQDAVAFKSFFSPLSIRALESSWEGESYGRAGSWDKVMKGILEPTGGPPEVLEEKVLGNPNQMTVQLRIDGVRRNIYLEKVVRKDRYLDPLPICSDWQPDLLCSDWRIDVLQGINANVNEEIRKEKKKKVEENKEEVVAEPREEGWWRPEDESEKKPPAVEAEPDPNKALPEGK